MSSFQGHPLLDEIAAMTEPPSFKLCEGIREDDKVVGQLDQLESQFFAWLEQKSEEHGKLVAEAKEAPDEGCRGCPSFDASFGSRCFGHDAEAENRKNRVAPLSNRLSSMYDAFWVFIRERLRLHGEDHLSIRAGGHIVIPPSSDEDFEELSENEGGIGMHLIIGTL